MYSGMSYANDYNYKNDEKEYWLDICPKCKKETFNVILNWDTSQEVGFCSECQHFEKKDDSIIVNGLKDNKMTEFEAKEIEAIEMPDNDTENQGILREPKEKKPKGRKNKKK